MIKLKAPVIVEGKYDKITLENVIDGLIIPTNGFGIFKDKEKCQMIKVLAQRYGVIVLTDSDSAGNMIRAYIKSIVGDSEIINVYVPRIKGKEKRKSHYGKEGILGVEGMEASVLEEALLKCGVNAEKGMENRRKITKTDLFLRGLSGGEGSGENRKRLLKYLDLPTNLTANAMLDLFNTMMSFEEFCEVTEKCPDIQTKN